MKGSDLAIGGGILLVAYLLLSKMGQSQPMAGFAGSGGGDSGGSGSSDKGLSPVIDNLLGGATSSNGLVPNPTPAGQVANPAPAQMAWQQPSPRDIPYIQAPSGAIYNINQLSSIGYGSLLEKVQASGQYAPYGTPVGLSPSGEIIVNEGKPVPQQYGVTGNPDILNWVS